MGTIMAALVLSWFVIFIIEKVKKQKLSRRWAKIILGALVILTLTLLTKLNSVN